jgi:hypothetical protein
MLMKLLLKDRVLGEVDAIVGPEGLRQGVHFYLAHETIIPFGAMEFFLEHDGIRTPIRIDNTGVDGLHSGYVISENEAALRARALR